MVRNFESLDVISSNDYTPKLLILCIVKDLTDVNSPGKTETFNLSNTYTISQLIHEVADRYSYEETSFCLMWKCGGDNINLSNNIYFLRTLSDIGLRDLNFKNVFEIHEKDGPPIRKPKSDYIIDEEPKIDDIELVCPYDDLNSQSFQPISCPYPSYIRNSKFYNDTTNEFAIQSSSSLLNSDLIYETGFVGLINQAMTCYLNSLLQTLFMTPEFRNAIYRWQFKPSTLLRQTSASLEQQIINNNLATKKNIPYQLQKLFLQMQTSNKKCLHTQDLTQSFGWGSDDAFQQHDVQELCRVMFDALEKMFKGTEQENLITELYQGKIKDYVKCVECNTESARVDVFLDIQLSIKSYIDEYNYNLYDSVEKALSAYIEPEILDGNNKYYCEKCKNLCKAHKGISFETFPYILCLQLKRFDFDYKTMMRIKLNNKVIFPEILDIKPYLAESTIISNPDVKTEYELFSIMIHSGSATGGHYYAYIRDFLSNQWYNFNDERVSRLDRQDIKKAYGVSYSSFSSTTAYMLLYRQIDAKRNEQFILKEQFPQHIIDLLKREQEELEEAERLKEYLENLCKIKVIIVNTNKIDVFKPVENENKEKQCSLHKDLTLEQAKLEIYKEFNLEDIDINKNTRLIKYDLYSEHIEQSFDNEKITVFEALNHMKQIYGFCWLFEIKTNTDEEFVSYKPGSITIKFIEINSSSYETTDLFNLRVDGEITSMELLMLVNNKLKIVDVNDDNYCDEIINNINLALERQHTIHPYVYLNEYLNKTLSSLGFLKSNKIFIEYRRKKVVRQEFYDDQYKNKFNKNKFFHILQTITNLIPLTCYLPNDEQCSIYKHKLERRLCLLEKKKVENSIKLNSYINENLATYDEVMIARGTSMNIKQNSDNNLSQSLLIPTVNVNNDNNDNNNNNNNNFTPQDHNKSFSKRRNAFIQSNTEYEEDEDELDFGNSVNKILKQKQEELQIMNCQEEQINENGSNGVLKRRFSDELSKSVDNIQLKTTKRSELSDVEDMSISSPPPAILNTVVSVSETSTVHLKDIEIDTTENKNQSDQQPQQQQQQQQQSQQLRYHKHHHHHNVIDMETSLDEGIGSGSSPSQIKNSPNSLDNLRGSPDTHLNEIDDIDSAVTSTTTKFDGNFIPSSCLYNDDNNSLGGNVDVVGDNDDIDDNESDAVDNLSTNNDHYGPYTHTFSNDNDLNKNPQFGDIHEDWDRDCELENLNKKIDYNHTTMMSTNDLEENNNETEEETYIKSVLNVNTELGTRILDITMDKRITMIDFKRHIKSYINVATEDFRIFRVGTNDFETELTRNEHQFQYIPINSKFIVKLGPTLKYGEYLVPVYKIIKNTGFTYLCDFMIEHGISVYDHKTLLKEDLKDECNEDIPLERMRLRKKTLRHPSTILLDEQIFGRDVFINTSTELCVELLDGPELKTEKLKTSVYLRKWNPTEYELSSIEEIFIDGQSFDELLLIISKHSNIDLEFLEVLRCKREYPFKIPILEIHKDSSWRENYLHYSERIEDGYCFYYRDRRLLLGELTDEKRRELTKDSLKTTSSPSILAAPLYSSSSYFKKETGVKIHI